MLKTLTDRSLCGCAPLIKITVGVNSCNLITLARSHEKAYSKLICSRAGDCVWFAVVLRAKAARIISKNFQDVCATFRCFLRWFSHCKSHQRGSFGR